MVYHSGAWRGHWHRVCRAVCSDGHGSHALIATQTCGWPQALLMAGTGALLGTLTELFSPSEYDTVTVPIVILAVLLALGRILN